MPTRQSRNQQPPPDLNDCRLRLELESSMTVNMKTGEHRYPNIVRIKWCDQTPSGKDKWVDALGGPLMAVADEDGTVRDDLTYSELLEAVARILAQQQPDPPESDGSEPAPTSTVGPDPCG